MSVLIFYFFTCFSEIILQDASATAHSVLCPVSIVRRAKTGSNTGGHLQWGKSSVEALLLMGRLHIVGSHAGDLVRHRHVLRFLLQETGDQYRLSARWIQHGHLPNGNVIGREFHNCDWIIGKSRGDVFTSESIKIAQLLLTFF